jgi:hypothetical protein
MHSFSRVIRRHENEALLQQPFAWHRDSRSTTEGRVRPPRSSFGRSFQVRTRRCRRHDIEASRSPRADPPRQVETRPNPTLPTQPEVDSFSDDVSSCHRSDTKLTERVYLGHRYYDSLPSLPSRPDIPDDQLSLQASHIVT